MEFISILIIASAVFGILTLLNVLFSIAPDYTITYDDCEEWEK